MSVLCIIHNLSLEEVEHIEDELSFIQSAFENLNPRLTDISIFLNLAMELSEEDAINDFSFPSGITNKERGIYLLFSLAYTNSEAIGFVMENQSLLTAIQSA